MLASTVSIQSETGLSKPLMSFSAFWRVITLTFAVVILATAALNVLVDPFDIYGVGLLPRSEVNYYEMKLELFDEFDPRPEALIIGSSRVLAFDPDVVEEMIGERCFNFSVAGAKAETFYAILRLALDDYDAPIHTVILGVDPESFHPAMPIQPESRFVSAYAKYFIHDPSGQATMAERLSLLLTLDQTSESISSIQTYLKERTGQAKMEFRDDGFATWIQREREIEEGTYDLQSRLDQRIRKYPERSLRLSEFTALDETRKEYWEDFLQLCEDKGIRVYAFLPAMHPQLLEVLNNLDAGRILGEVADYLDDTVSESGGVFRDYTDIRSFGGDPDLFYDEIHMRPENGEKLLKDLLGEAGAGRKLPDSGSNGVTARDRGLRGNR